LVLPLGTFHLSAVGGIVQHHIDRSGTVSPQSLEAFVVALVILVCAYVLRRSLRARGLKERRARWIGTAFIAIALAIYFALRLWVI
jgi:hypothetical protein